MKQKIMKVGKKVMSILKIKDPPQKKNNRLATIVKLFFFYLYAITFLEVQGVF